MLNRIRRKLFHLCGLLLTTDILSAAELRPATTQEWESLVKSAEDEMDGFQADPRSARSTAKNQVAGWSLKFVMRSREQSPD
jgi:hypothetical protein